MSIHSYGVNAGQSLEDVLETQYSSHQPYLEPLQTLFAAYARRKRELSVFDYDDLLLKWRELLDHPQAGDRIRERFEYVLVDEYQDTNHLQSELLLRLVPDGRGLTVVGDDAQSIYSFRAATVRNILDFPQQFPGTTVVTLEQNYRSTQPILEATNRVIAQAKQRYTKDLWSDRRPGPTPQLVTCEDEREQVEFVVGRILQHQELGIPLRQQAVLFRAAHHSILLEAELARHALPFVKYGGLKFVESAHVKDVLSFLRLAQNPRDPVAGGRALLLLPGIGPKKAWQLQAQLGDAAGRFEVWDTHRPPAKAKILWPAFVGLIKQLATAEACDLAGQVQRVLKFYQPLLEEKYDNLQQRLSDLEQLQQLAGSFSDRAEMLADLTVDPPTSTADLPRSSRDEDCLVLSTMHSAKGLEWHVVYVLHASEGKIPLSHALFSPDQVEEERRMFYVAMTRAADWLYVCRPQRESQSRYQFGWDGDLNEQTKLTRFVTKSAKKAFQCQQAALFEMPADPAPSTAPPRKRKRRKATRRAGR